MQLRVFALLWLGKCDLRSFAHFVSLSITEMADSLHGNCKEGGQPIQHRWPVLLRVCPRGMRPGWRVPGSRKNTGKCVSGI